jgi:uncharacterized protein (DUF885 family)
MTTPIFDLSDRYIDKVAELSPGSATYLGIAGYDHLMTDFSPTGHGARHDLDVSTLAELDRLAPENDDDRLAAGVLRESLQAAIQAHGSGEHLRSIRIIAGDVESARSVFDLMPAETADDWSTIAERLSHVPEAFAGMRASWSLGLERGVVTSKRQVIAQADQLEYWSGTQADPAFFEQYVESAASVPGAPVAQWRRHARRDGGDGGVPPRNVPRRGP